MRTKEIENSQDAINAHFNRKSVYFTVEKEVIGHGNERATERRDLFLEPRGILDTMIESIVS